MWIQQMASKNNKKMGLISVGLHAFSEASGCFADETIAFKLLPACNRLDIATKTTPLCFRLGAKRLWRRLLSNIWAVKLMRKGIQTCMRVYILIYIHLCPKHYADKMAKERKEGIVFQCPIVCGPFTSHFCTEAAFCSTGVSVFPRRGLISPNW